MRNSKSQPCCDCRSTTTCDCDTRWCDDCGGEGVLTCTKCDGLGYPVDARGEALPGNCGSCSGDGHGPCPTCNGTGNK
jgi:hypothetical protein